MNGLIQISATSLLCINVDFVFTCLNSFPALDHICKDIGTQWRELARNLSIREGEIDDIEVQYPRNLKERAYEVFSEIAD